MEFNGYKIANEAREQGPSFKEFWEKWAPGQDEFNLMKSAANTRKRGAEEEAKSEPKKSATATTTADATY